ncbi:hypothetical protein [Lysinibacillus xylanilyticus]|uniref:YopX protein domain-containing protein n=1 Tax=Lysinibacillus xylanilyticus TaxID=582475 RepID=A0ABT4EWC3_9BACI|nr:hypothetical protein [Lysinibacillus xylanilyticus]MCY9549333.1 hypothetical protein [Lysinibacillus xylanilyticus]
MKGNDNCVRKRLFNTKGEIIMGKYFGTKNDAYNLKFKEHEVFEGKLVVVDESDTPFIRLDKETE